MFVLPRALGLFILTAVAEVVGCYLPYLWRVSGPARGTLQGPWWH